MKRVVDLLLSMTLMILLLPVFLLLSVIIRSQIGSPVFFKQERPGLNGEAFYIYKFRTMTDERDAQGCLLPDEKRLTKVGEIIRKCSLDELSQLFNVLKGELSLVGPRPLLMEYLPLYNSQQARRHQVKPGITGWAQVNGRNAISWDEKFELDVWYVDNHSFWLDMKILWMTVLKVMKREGISHQGHITMEKFRGSGKCRNC
jgi:sugar transferase EpsL